MELVQRIGLAAVVAAIWTALLCSSALASEFETEKYPSTVTGAQEGNQVLTTKIGKAKCAKASLSGGLHEPSATLTLNPEYSECTFAGLKATVATEGCIYMFQAGEETKENSFAGTVDLVCPTGHKIVITAGTTCKIEIPGGQAGLSSLTYGNNVSNSPPDITLEQNISGLKYTYSGLFCGSGSGEEGSLTGNVRLKGFVGPEQVPAQMGKPAKTKLCAEKPPCKVIYKKGQTFEAVKSGPVLLDLEGEVAISCTTSKITSATQELEEAPLHLEKFGVTLTGCIDEGGACTNVTMTNQPTANLYAFGMSGAGNITVLVTLSVECPKAKCEYKSVKPIAMFFKGGTPKGEIIFQNQGIPKNKIGGEMGCTENLFWDGVYEVNEPKPVWPSR